MKLGEDKMFKVYDHVWIMENNKPKEKIVFAVINSMDYSKKGTETFLQLVDSQLGAGWGYNEGVRRRLSEVFTDKESLIRGL